MFRKPSSPEQPGSPASVTDAAPCQKALRLRVPPETVAPVRQRVVAEVQRQAVLPGFRKGKAPADLVERHYAQRIQDETLQRVMQEAFEQAAKDHALKPIGPFEVQTAQVGAAGEVLLEATVEVEPSFALGPYKGLALTRQPADVGPEEVARVLASLQESMAQLVPRKEGEGKERQVPPLDDELAKDLGFTSLPELRAHAEAKLREQKRAASAQALEQALFDALLARHTFELPPRLVSHQTERLTREFKTRLLLAGKSEEQVAQAMEPFLERLRTSAERQVKLSFILDRIAAQESVTVAQEDVVKRLWQLAQRWKKDPAQVRQRFDAQGLWPSVVSALRQEKTVALVLASAAIENGAEPKEERA